MRGERGDCPTTREPEFRDIVDDLIAASTEIAQQSLAQFIPSGPRLDWAARVVPTLTRSLPVPGQMVGNDLQS